MPKKYLVSTLAFFLALGLSACPASDTGDTTQSTESPAAAAQSEAPPASDSETPAANESAPAATTQAASGDVELGKKVFMEKTCATCHVISSMEGAVGVVGPKLDGLGAAAATREAGKDAETYIRESIEDPNAFVNEGYPAAMPPLRSTMSDEEYEGLVAYLLSL